MAGRKVAILGTARTWKDAPFNDPKWEIWVPNRSGLKMKPWHRLFEIHQNWDYESPEARDKYLADLKAIKPPQKVVSIVPLEGPANVVIDRDKLFEKYGRIWFSSTFGYMIAMALEEGVSELGFWGVDMDSHEEAIVQFYGVRHFIDLAKSKGIRVTVPPRSTLMREPGPYADRFETVQALCFEETAADLKKKIARCQLDMVEWCAEWLKPEDAACLAQMRENIARLRGELIATQHYRRLFAWNVFPPKLGEEDETQIDDVGPC